MSAERAEPWSAVKDGVALSIRVTPKGGRDTIDGIAAFADGRVVLKARVRAAPSEGQANDALIRLVAKTLGVPARDVALSAGATGRIKRLVILGDPPTLTAALEKIAAAR